MGSTVFGLRKSAAATSAVPSSPRRPEARSESCSGVSLSGAVGSRLGIDSPLAPQLAAVPAPSRAAPSPSKSSIGATRGLGRPQPSLRGRRGPLAIQELRPRARSTGRTAPCSCNSSAAPKCSVPGIIPVGRGGRAGGRRHRGAQRRSRTLASSASFSSFLVAASRSPGSHVCLDEMAAHTAGSPASARRGARPGQRPGSSFSIAASGRARPSWGRPSVACPRSRAIPIPR